MRVNKLESWWNDHFLFRLHECLSYDIKAQYINIYLYLKSDLKIFSAQKQDRLNEKIALCLTYRNASPTYACSLYPNVYECKSKRHTWVCALAPARASRGVSLEVILSICIYVFPVKWIFIAKSIRVHLHMYLHT